MRFTVPGSKEEYGFALFLAEDETGASTFPDQLRASNGKLGDQLGALLEGDGARTADASEGQDRHYRLFLLPAQPKDNPERKGEPPTFCDRANLAPGSEPIQISVWKQESRFHINRHVTKYLRGNTQYA